MAEPEHCAKTLNFLVDVEFEISMLKYFKPVEKSKDSAENSQDDAEFTALDSKSGLCICCCISAGQFSLAVNALMCCT